MTAQIINMEEARKQARGSIGKAMYKQALGVDLSPDQVQFIRFTTALLFKTNAAHVAVLKEEDKYIVLSMPYDIHPLTYKVRYLNSFKYLYRKMFSSIVVGGFECKSSEVQEMLEARLGVKINFVRQLPQIPSYKLEEILNEQKSK